MSKQQKNLKSISIVELVLGLLYLVEGLIVTSNKAPYFISAVITVVTALLCYMAVNDSSKAKPAKIMLWISIVLGVAGTIAGIATKGGATGLALGALDVCIAAYMIKLIKEIHG